jgi:hypothetical protein
MRKLFAVILFVLSFAGLPAHALECATFDKARARDLTPFPTANGAIMAAYFVNGQRLPIKTVALPGGTRVTGILPGQFPVGFLWVDKTSTVRAASLVSMQYVPQPNAPNGTAELWDAVHRPITTDPISPTPSYAIDTYFSLPQFRGIVQTDITMPNTLIVQFCVEPGDRVTSLKQWLRGHRRR